MNIWKEVIHDGEVMGWRGDTGSGDEVLVLVKNRSRDDISELRKVC